MKYQIDKYGKPIKKAYHDVKKYDVARFEYGDYDNWVNAIILKLTPEKNNKVLKIEFVTASGQAMVAYGFIDNGKHDFDIIGTAKEITKEPDKEV